MARSWGRTKPPVGTQPNYGGFAWHRLLDSWAFLEGGGKPFNLKRRISGTLAGNTSWTPSPAGTGIRSTGTGNTYVDTGTYSFGFTSPTIWTILAGFAVGAIGSNSRIFAHELPSNQNLLVSVGDAIGGSATTASIGIDTANTAAGLAVANSGCIVANSSYDAAFVHRGSGATNEIWLNGRKLSLAINDSTNPTDDSVRRLFFADTTNGSHLMNGTVSYLIVSDRAWTTAEIQEFQRSPWDALFAPPSRRFYFVDAAAPATPDLIHGRRRNDPWAPARNWMAIR